MGIALAVGAILGVRAAMGNAALWAVLAAGLAIALFAGLPRASWSILACFAAGCVTGALVASIRAPEAPPPRPARLPGTIHATILNDPQSTSVGVLATIRWQDSDGVAHASSAFLPAAPTLQRGDQVTARLEKTTLQPDEPLIAESIIITHRPAGMLGLRNDIRSAIRSGLDRRVRGAPGALALGLLIGDDSSLTARQRASIRNAGLAHITAVSGWNVSVVVAGIAACFAILHLRGPIWTGLQIAGVAAFVWLVGPDPPVVRAAIMCVAVFAARALGRPAHSITLLALTAAAMLCVSPGLFSSISFQLTIAATAGLLIAGAIAARWEASWSPIAGVALTAALAGVATMPVTWAAFGTLTPVGIPANIVVAPIVVVAAYSAIAAALAAPVPLLGAVAGSVAWALGRLILEAANVLSAIPYGHWQAPPLGPPGQAGVVATLVLFGAAFTPEGRAIRRQIDAWMTVSPTSCIAALTGAAVVLIACIVTL